MRLLTVAELACLLHWAEGTVRNRLSKGAPMPPSVMVGRHRLFWDDEAVAWVNSQRETILLQCGPNYPTCAKREAYSSSAELPSRIRR